MLHVVDAGGLLVPDVRDALQVWHAPAPTPGLYVPAWQYWQVDMLFAPTAEEYVPAEQFWHTTDAATGLYVPTGQFWHPNMPGTLL